MKMFEYVGGMGPNVSEEGSLDSEIQVEQVWTCVAGLLTEFRRTVKLHHWLMQIA